MAMRDTVVASRAGTVLAVQSHNPDGTRECGMNKENFVFVQHGDGTVMRYIHLTQNGVLVQEGQQLAQGQPLGLSGDSGCSSGPHVHIDLHHDATFFGRQSTLPVNDRNADGPLDRNNGLQQATR
jgi:murein DD-endopeptidase MepM/ murein hydrolase activator NlpD